MQKRNFILLIIILIITAIAIFGFLYFQKPTTDTTGDGTEGTNFFSQFNPFGTKPKPPTETPPVDVPEYIPPSTISSKLVKVSSMPVAGFGLFNKERLKEVPITAPATVPSVPYNFGSTTLKNGSTGEGVMEIQRFLNDVLNLGLELDGVLDAEIITAIKQWQSNNGLVADGVVGAKTKMMMYSSVNQVTETKKPISPPTEFISAIRYVDKVTGNIYQTFADKIDENKFSETTIPKVYEAYFGNRAESVIMRYLKIDKRNIETFVGILPKELLGGDTTENNKITGSFLPNNVKDVSISPDGQKIFYLWISEDNMIGTILNLLNNKKTQVFDSPFTEWLSFWPNNNIITLTTKPSYGVPGYMYTINSAGQNLSKILGDINGLTTLESPNGKIILYGNSNLSLYIYNTESRNSTTLSIKSMPEKCVWGKGNDIIYCAVPKLTTGSLYPDTWYQGEVSFNDQIWKIDIVTGNATLLADPATEGASEIDGIKLAIDETENYLFFVNKKDSFLWKLDLK